MNKRLILTGILLGTMTIGTMTYAGARNIVVHNSAVQVNMEENDLYPLRKISEILGIEISRVTENQIVLKQGANIVTLNRHNQYLKNNKGYFVSKSVPIQKDGQTYVSLEVVEKMFGYTCQETEAGIVINKNQVFNLPQPTQISQRLHNDLNYIELLEEKIDMSYYRAAIQTGIKDYDMQTITAARQKAVQDLNMIGEIEVYLQSDTGRKMAISYKELVGAYKLILDNAFNLNVREMSCYFISLMEAEDHVEASRENFTAVIEKNATKL